MTMLASRHADAPERAVPPSAHPHFAVLDGLRGLAALAVVLVHTFRTAAIRCRTRISAVDLFFILSGFVIAHSYEPKLDSGMRAAEFLQRRFIRLYPMLFVGAFGGLLIALINHRAAIEATDPLPAILFSGGAVVAGTALPGPGRSPGVFSYDPPMWSLFFEILANLAYVALAVTGLARRPNAAILALVVAAGLAGVVWCGPLGGAGVSDFASGLPRVACGFFGGVLLFKLSRARAPTSIRAGWVWPFLGLGALFALPVAIGGWLFPPAFARAVPGGAGRRPRPPRPFRPGVRVPGPGPTRSTCCTGSRLPVRGGGPRPASAAGPGPAWVALLHLAAVPGIGYLAARCYETPLRRLLGRALLPTPQTPGLGVR